MLNKSKFNYLLVLLSKVFYPADKERLERIFFDFLADK